MVEYRSHRDAENSSRPHPYHGQEEKLKGKKPRKKTPKYTEEKHESGKRQIGKEHRDRSERVYNAQ
jgi:hypothetical protein